MRVVGKNWSWFDIVLNFERNRREKKQNDESMRSLQNIFNKPFHMLYVIPDSYLLLFYKIVLTGQYHLT